MQRDRREEAAVVKLQAEFDVVLGGKVAGRAEEGDIGNAERPDLVNFEIGADEPVEFVPRADGLTVLPAIDVVPDASDQRNVVDRRGRIMEGVQDETVEDLCREPVAAYQKAARGDVVVLDGKIVEAVDSRRRVAGRSLGQRRTGNCGETE